jgi:hypothetical protein
MNETVRTGTTTTLKFDLHPLYASILEDGATIRKGEVLGLDGDLRRVLVAPVTGTIRLLATGAGADRRVKVFLTEQRSDNSTLATARR